MASPPDRYKWALYAVRCSGFKPSNIHVIPDSINRLLRYAETYPPALALARSKVARIDLDEEYAGSQFLVSYSYLVLSYLEDRKALPFFKATNRVNEWGYRRKGENYWIVGYRTGLVNWVSSDFHVYTDDVTGFEVSEDELRRFK